MLKKMMAMVASKVMAIKVRIRAVETHFMIQSLLLRDKKMVRHLFQRRKCFKHSDTDHLPDDDSESVVKSSVTTTPASVIMQVAKEIEDTMDIKDDDVYPSSDDLPFEDYPEEVYPNLDNSPLQDYPQQQVDPVSVTEMAYNANEGRGKEFKLENDIDKVADLFIQRFHHQIWLQKQYSDEGIHA